MGVCVRVWGPGMRNGCDVRCVGDSEVGRGGDRQFGANGAKPEPQLPCGVEQPHSTEDRLAVAVTYPTAVCIIASAGRILRRSFVSGIAWLSCFFFFLGFFFFGPVSFPRGFQPEVRSSRLVQKRPP